MDKKAAVIVAPGFEEGETLTIVDILRRANITCHTFGFGKEVTGGHHITLRTDYELSKEVEQYDMIILPGGYGGADTMRNSDLLMEILRNMMETGKFVTAMCAAPIALERAGVLHNRNYTAYVGYGDKIKDGTYLEDKVVIDGNLITSRAPATTYAFAYKLVDALGGDSLAVKKRMAYFSAFDVKEDE